jgi:uridine nucleosidase
LSILEAVGKRDIEVHPGAVKPFCREAKHAPDIHGILRRSGCGLVCCTDITPGESGLDGTTILPAPEKNSITSENNGAVHAMYQALAGTAPQTAWLVSTGSLTNIGLLFAVYPALADHIAGLSVMGGAIGGFFTHAPIGRLRERIPMSESVSREFPGGLPDDSDMSISDIAKHFRELDLLDDADNIDDRRVHEFLEQARRSFGNTTHYAEFNIYCDPEAAASVFSNQQLAAKTTLIPLDVTHQVLGNKAVLELLSNNYAGPDDKLADSAVRHLFLEIMMFFARTYETEFGMSEGPPLHDPIAVAATFAPEMFDDQGGERFEVHVVKAGDDNVFEHERNKKSVGQCGRTIARMLPKGKAGVRIPRTLKVPEFWEMINFSLDEADKASSLTF